MDGFAQWQFTVLFDCDVAIGFDPVGWTPHKRECSLCQHHVGSSPPELKDEAVKLVTTTGRAVATIARGLGINEPTLGRWVTAYRARHETGLTEVTESERAELLRLRKENADLKRDRAFLQNVLGFKWSS